VEARIIDPPSLPASRCRALAPADLIAGKGHRDFRRSHGISDDLSNIVTDTAFPLEPTAAEAQAAIAEEFGFFGDWSERYQYLIDLGRKLPPFPEAAKTEEHRLHGCQSMVWILPSGSRERLDFAAVSDSAIVSGLIYLALRVYSGRSAEEILETQPDYIAGIGLARHLSPTRSNGLAALLGYIRETAQRAAG